MITIKVALTNIAASALARMRTRAESFGPVEPSHSHVRMEAKRAAMEALAKSSKMEGYDTNHDANALPQSLRIV